MKKRARETEYYFAIVLKDVDKVIGEIDAYPERGEPHDTISPLDTFSPCWMLNKAYQGKGYAYEAAHAFFDYLFQDMRIVNVERVMCCKICQRTRGCTGLIKKATEWAKKVNIKGLVFTVRNDFTGMLFG